MRKIVILLLFATASFCVHAASDYKEAGKAFAQLKACRFAGQLSKRELDRANVKIIKKYQVAQRTDWWREQMQKARFKEFKALDNAGPIKLGIMCGILEDKYAK